MGRKRKPKGPPGVSAKSVFDRANPMPQQNPSEEPNPEVIAKAEKEAYIRSWISGVIDDVYGDWRRMRMSISDFEEGSPNASRGGAFWATIYKKLDGKRPKGAIKAGKDELKPALVEALQDVESELIRQGEELRQQQKITENPAVSADPPAESVDADTLAL